MLKNLVLVVLHSAVLNAVWCSEIPFPPWFKLGTASSSYQIEGAWNVSDKAESNQDRYMHWPFSPGTPEAIMMGDNGDVTADSYHLWPRDVEMLAELGVDFYRFSISWSRLLPKSYSNYISEDGKQYYNNLIDGLLERGIEPVVTIYHFELPQMLQDLGGWTNPLIADWFADYARVLFFLYGDRVKTWLTINEPIIMCDAAYTAGFLAPGIVEPKHAMFLCNKHVLLAHAKAWRIYDEEFKPKYGGKVSIANHLLWLKPYSEDDQQLTELTYEYIVGRYAHPIFSKEGGWPPQLENYMQELSFKEGHKTSRLPPFTPDEIQLIKGTYDFFGLNYYTVKLVRAAKPGDTLGSFFYEDIEDLNVVMEVDPEWPMQLSEYIVLINLYENNNMYYKHHSVSVVLILFCVVSKSAPTNDTHLNDTHNELIVEEQHNNKNESLNEESKKVDINLNDTLIDMLSKLQKELEDLEREKKLLYEKDTLLWGGCKKEKAVDSHRYSDYSRMYSIANQSFEHVHLRTDADGNINYFDICVGIKADVFGDIILSPYTDPMEVLGFFYRIRLHEKFTDLDIIDYNYKLNGNKFEENLITTNITNRFNYDVPRGYYIKIFEDTLEVRREEDSTAQILIKDPKVSLVKYFGIHSHSNSREEYDILYDCRSPTSK